jgi:hypothetical protein
MEYVKTFDTQINDTLSQFVRKPTLIRGIVHLLLVLYSARLAPTLPKRVLLLFENQYFKLFVFSLVLWTAQFSPSTSILIAIAFMVTVNYANQRPLWEFIENTEAVQTSAPEAPNKDVAVAATSAVVNAQVENTPVVTAVEQKSETIVVQPQIVPGPDGPTVVNPTVVVAPVVVETPSGEKVVIQPDVATVKVDQEAAAAVMAAKAEAAPVVEAPVAPAVEAPAVPVVEAPAAPAAPAVEAPVVEPAPAPAPAPVQPKEPVAEPAPTPAAQLAAQEGCYPIRRYDMSKVSPQASIDYYGSWSA